MNIIEKRNVFTRVALFVVSLVFSLGVSASELWTWVDECHSRENKTQCSVWFDSALAVENISASYNGQVLDVQVEPFAANDEESVNIVFVQLDNVRGEGSVASVKKGLKNFVNSHAANQLVGIYADGDNLQVIAALGSNRSALDASIETLAWSEGSHNTAGHLQSLVAILDGTPHKRKVIHWVTTGLNLNDDEIHRVTSILNDAGIHLAVVLLQKSELDSNLSAQFNPVLSVVNGVLVSGTPNTWDAIIEISAPYSNNGAHLTIATPEFCGDRLLQFAATAGEAIERSVLVNYTACEVLATSEPVPVSTSEAVAEVTPVEPSSSSNEVAADVSEGNGSLVEGVVDGGVERIDTEAPVPVDETTEEGVNADEPLVTSPEGEQPEATTLEATLETTPESDVTPELDPNMPVEEELPIDGALLMEDNTTVIVVASVLLLAVLIGGVLLVRKNKKSTDSPVVFAYLYEYASTGEIKHEVSSTTTRLGRGSSNDIVLMGDTVSSVHAVLKRERDDSLTLVDLNSSNGTKVNNRPITQETIESGDVIMLGEYSIKIQRIG